MIIRETKMVECWCPSCNKGQMAQLFQKSFDEKKQLTEYVGKVITCQFCGSENIIEDFISLMPQEFLVFSNSNKSKYKINDDLKRFLNS